MPARMKWLFLLALSGLVPAPAVAAPNWTSPSPNLVAAFLGDWPQLQALDPAARGETFIVVDVARQQLYLFKHGTLAASWPVSTAAAGTGEAAGSFKTPLGAFRIVRKIGKGLGEFATLSRHGPTGGAAAPVYAADDRAAGDVITTRILMLEGLEPGWNEGGDVDTLRRHIYIHGTADLGQLGEPASEGCVEMAPGAMIRLFRAVRPGTPVLITPGRGTPQTIPGEVYAGVEAGSG